MVISSMPIDSHIQSLIYLSFFLSVALSLLPFVISSSLLFKADMNYTPTKVGGFWEHEVVFRLLHVYSQYLTYGTSLFYHG